MDLGEQYGGKTIIEETDDPKRGSELQQERPSQSPGDLCHTNEYIAQREFARREFIRHMQIQRERPTQRKSLNPVFGVAVMVIATVCLAAIITFLLWGGGTTASAGTANATTPQVEVTSTGSDNGVVTQVVEVTATPVVVVGTIGNQITNATLSTEGTTVNVVTMVTQLTVLLTMAMIVGMLILVVSDI